MQFEQTNLEYEFTATWFKENIPTWEKIKSELRGRKDFLEIGSFEGYSSVWTIENFIEDGGQITCIDTWEGSEEHSGLFMNDVENRFKSNINKALYKCPGRTAFSIKSPSLNALCGLILQQKSYDFIYIDGSHTSRDVITDACLSWPLLRKDGILVFDDYLWNFNMPYLRKPKAAIDSFTMFFNEELEIIHNSYQVIVRKII